MAYRKYKYALYLRLALLLCSMALLAYAISQSKIYYITFFAITTAFLTYYFLSFTTRRFMEMDSFFESVKYRDFTRWFLENSGPEDINELHKGFNQVNKTLQSINNEKEAQFVIRQKILELINTGIITYQIETLEILWMNESFKQILNIPSIKNVGFIKSRNPQIFTQLFSTEQFIERTITLDIKNEKVKILVSSSIFKVDEKSIKLIVLQNIDDALNRNESEAWKKLLSVMTHEIMNSIAPISSLAETLQSKVQLSMSDTENHPLEIEDLEAGIESIKSRSEGLYKFAQIYRSLNNVTHLNLERVSIKKLFGNISNLMKSSLAAKGIQFIATLENDNLQVEMDSYLIEQVLINLILNASEACKDRLDSEINLSAKYDVEGNVLIKVSDNGKGIPNEILDRIFIPFFTTKKNGSGIGLSLSKQIMLLHDGRIQVQSVEGKGTVIGLYF